MGGKVQFVIDMQTSGYLDEGLLREIATNIGQITMTGNVSKSAIYTLDGKLIAFALSQDDGNLFIGYVSDLSKGTIKTGISNKTQTDRPWKNHRHERR